jgi:hypothetical protein
MQEQRIKSVAFVFAAIATAPALYLLTSKGQMDRVVWLRLPWYNMRVATAFWLMYGYVAAVFPGRILTFEGENR